MNEKKLNKIIKENIRKALNETLKEQCNKFIISEIYDGVSGGAYNGGRYLSKSITSQGKTPIALSQTLLEGVDFEPSENEKGGVIVFSTDVNAIKQHDNKIVNWIKQKMSTLANRLNATKKIDKIASENELVGWTIGHYLNGRYTAKNGKQYGENSLSVEIFGVDFDSKVKIAEELCASFKQESVLLKDNSSGRVLFINQS